MVRTLRPSRAWGPQRLQRVHRAAVADHADTLRSGHATASTGCDRRRKTRSSRPVLQPVVRCGRPRSRKEAAPRGDGFHRPRMAFSGIAIGQRLRDRGVGQGARRFWPARPFSAAWHPPAWRRPRSPMRRGLRPNFLPRTVMRWDLAAVGLQHARLVRIGEKRHRIVGIDQHDVLEILQDRQRLLDHVGNPVDREPSPPARHPRIVGLANTLQPVLPENLRRSASPCSVKRIAAEQQQRLGAAHTFAALSTACDE